MKISLLEPIGVSRETIDALAAPLIERGHEFVCYDAKTTDIEELKRRSADSDIVMIANNPYPNEVVRAAEKLKVLDVAFTGIDHVGLEACRERSVTVLNAANYSNQTVAELAVGMAIDLLRHVIPADRAVREGKTSAGLMGREIAGRTVGMLALEMMLLCFAVGVLVQLYLQSAPGNFAVISAAAALLVLSCDWLFFYRMPGYSGSAQRYLWFVLPSAALTIPASLVEFAIVRHIYNKFKIDNGVV